VGFTIEDLFEESIDLFLPFENAAVDRRHDLLHPQLLDLLDESLLCRRQPDLAFLLQQRLHLT